MYGARHVMLHARAMPCGGGLNSGGGCQKTPDFGLVEGSRCPLKTCRNAKSCMRMPHDGACHVTGPPVPFLRNAARGKTKHRERSHGRDSTAFCPPPAHLPNFAMAFVGPKANHSRGDSRGHEGVGEFRPPKVGHFHTKMRVQLKWKSSKNFSRRALNCKGPRWCVGDLFGSTLLGDTRYSLLRCFWGCY